MVTITTQGQGITSVLDPSTNPGEVLVEFDARNSDLEGSFFINEEWQNADIYLKTGSILTNMEVRFDLEFELLEVNLKSQIKVIPIHKFKKFIINNDLGHNISYVNCESYKYEDKTPLTGICEVVDSSYFGMIIKYRYNIKEPTYVPALDMGTQSPEILINNDILLLKGSTTFPLPKNKNKFLSLYEPLDDSVEVFMKRNKINHKNKDNLLQVLNYINSLSQTHLIQ